MDAQQRIATAYANSDTIERQRRAADEATGKAWRWDDQMERLAVLVESGHPVAGELRMALGYYEQSKAAAKAEGIDTGGPS